MNLYAFRKGQSHYRANYRMHNGNVINLRIVNLENEKEIGLSFLFSEEEQKKFFRVLKIHSLKWGGC